MRTAEESRALYTWLTTSEVADSLRCSPTHVRALIRAGDLRAFVSNPRSSRPDYRIAPDELRRFVDAHTTAAA